MEANIEVRIAQMSTTIENLDSKADETLALLRQLNGTVREHGEKLATIEQWRISHDKETHGTINGEIKTLRQRDTASSGIAAVVGSIIGGIIGIIAAIKSP